MESVIKTAFPFIVYKRCDPAGLSGRADDRRLYGPGRTQGTRLDPGTIGPNRVGPWGVLQPFADLHKFIFKEDLVPDKSTKFVYFLAPMVALTCALLPIVVYPFGPAITTIDWSFLPYGLGDNIRQLPMTIAQIDVGVLFVLGITSVGVYGIALAGWCRTQIPLIAFWVVGTDDSYDLALFPRSSCIFWP